MTFSKPVLGWCLTTRHIYFIFVFFSGITVLSAQAAKPGLDIEDEINLDANKKNPVKKNQPPKEGENDIVDKTAVVEGEDEQILPSRKEETEINKPEAYTESLWDSKADELTRKEKMGAKEVEKKASIKTEYGSYNSLGANIFVTKKDKYGSYLLEYNREKRDAEGFNTVQTGNSAFSSDYLNLAGGFTVSPLYSFLLKTNYADVTTGLQSNNYYTQQFKRRGALEFQNQIRPSDTQKLNLGVTGEFVSSAAENPVALRRDVSSLSKVKADYEWQYIFGQRNALTLGGNFWYGENQVYTQNNTDHYRIGEFYIWDIFPLYQSYQGEEKKLLQVDLLLGAQISFGSLFQPVAGPRIGLDVFYDKYIGKLEVERKGKVPDSDVNFIRMYYTQPVYYSEFEDSWHASIKNSLKVSKTSLVKLNLLYSNYNIYYNPRFNVTSSLYEAKAMVFRAFSAALSLQQNLSEWFYYESGVKGEYQADDVNLRSPAEIFANAHFVPQNWDIGIEIMYTGLRRSETDSLKAYTMLNMSVERSLNPTVKLFTRAENIFNEAYQRTFAYAASGFKIYGGLNILF